MLIPVLLNPGFSSYLTAFLAFFFLSILLLISARTTRLGRRLIFASLTTTAWALCSALSTIITAELSFVIDLLEVLRTISWCYFLLGTISTEELNEDQQADSGKNLTRSTLLSNWVWPFAGAILLINIAILPWAGQHIYALNRFIATIKEVQLISLIALALIGLLLIEQVIRNIIPNQRWAIKYLCLGTGGIFVYDFFLYSNALLFKNLDLDLWSARGVVNALTVPLIAISAARSAKLKIDIHVSRDAVFHSVTLVSAGAYLMAMAGMGYYIQLYGGEWGNLLQILFLAGAGLLLAILLFSGSIRNKTRVFLSKHFYSFKYDYREQWLRFTNNLGNTSESVLDRICHSLAEIVHSSGGLLWSKNQHNHLELINGWQMADDKEASLVDSRELRCLDVFLQDKFWVIDLIEYQHEPEKYPQLNLPQSMLNIPNAWLLVPLAIEQKVLGFVLLKQSPVETSLNWEDHDLLKMAGQQAAILLAQYQSEHALIEARQFEAFNRLSAYTMHDLKNILAQQSLIVSNAEKHKHKPEFIEDMIATVANSVDRMTRLLEQMKRGERSGQQKPVELNQLLAKCIKQHSSQRPLPELQSCNQPVIAQADANQLATVFGHMIQNAQEATPDDGKIVVTISSSRLNCLVTISDTGSGMDSTFIRDRLFKPFDSTKGLTGMGIGAFESRNYIQSLGGNIKVESEPGKGSAFNITLPLITSIIDG